MATYNNITLLPGSGSGDTGLSITATDNWGREGRNAVFTAENTDLNIQSDNNLIVTQSGHAAFISLENATVPSSGGVVTMSGYSNYQTLTFSDLAGGNSLLTYFQSAAISTDITVTDVQDLTSGYSPTGDPGSTNRYPIILTFNIPSAADAGTYTFSVNGNTFTCTKEGGSQPVETEIWFSDGQSSTPSSINLTITLDADGNRTGGASSPYINTDPSGTSWTIS